MRHNIVCKARNASDFDALRAFKGIFDAAVFMVIVWALIALAFVSGAFAQVPVPNGPTVTGTITSNQSVVLNSNGKCSFAWAISGTWTGTITSQVQDPSGAWAAFNVVAAGGSTTSSFTANGGGIGILAGLNVRFLGTTVATGTATVTLTASPGCAANRVAAQSQQVVGAAASGATVSGNPVLNGGRAATQSPTAVTDGQAVALLLSKEGVTVTRPYSITENFLSGSSGNVANTSQTSIIAAQGASIKIYVTDLVCGNSGASTSVLTFTDSASTVVINPAGGGISKSFNVPLVVAANTAFQMTPGTASTNQFCTATGYKGP